MGKTVRDKQKGLIYIASIVVSFIFIFQVLTGDEGEFLDNFINIILYKLAFSVSNSINVLRVLLLIHVCHMTL